MRVAVDTNILAYAEGVDRPEDQENAWHVLEGLSSCELHVPVQVLGELFNVLIKKGKRTRTQARDSVLTWQDSYRSIDIREDVTLASLDLANDHSIGIWDAVILAASAHAGCRILLSEDMHHGFTWWGTTVVNPFLAAPHPLLTPFLTR